MEINYQCTFGDYKEAMDSQMSGPTVAYFLAIGGLIVLTISISVIVKSGFSAGAVGPLVGGLFLICPLLLRILRNFWIERDFRKHPSFSGAARVLVDGEGIITTGELERRETKWSLFTNYRETENLFILHDGARLMRVFPKRTFSYSELEEFRQLLQSKIVPK